MAEDQDGYLGVAYSSLTPYLVEAVKELKAETDAEIEELKTENAELRRLIEQMNTRLTRLEGGIEKSELK